MIVSLLLGAFIANSSSPPEPPMIPAFFTGERLYEICIGPNEPQCWMYVAGVVDATFEAEATAPERSICRSDITNRDAAARVTRYLQQNEAIRVKAAAIAVKAALSSELACNSDG